MIFTKDLLLKGLAGLALCTGTAALGVHYMGGFSSLFGEVKISRVEDIGLTTSETCKLPEVGATTSCDLTAENINNIKFDGKTNETVTGTGTLQISIPGNDEKDIFPHGYKVTITASTNDITITRSSGDSLVLKASQATDFKIIQKENNKFSLEKAWTDEKLAKKIGLENKDAEGKWSLDGKTIKVKYETGSIETKTASSAQPGKIKAYADTSYNQGFKFVIEDGDINLGEGTITKLEQFETYEIKKESEGWVLVRKTKAIDEIKTTFGLPTEAAACTETGGVTECASLDQTKLSAIKFEGKGDGSVTVNDIGSANIKLKISKTTDTNFTFGYKFVLESEKDITISQVSGTSITIKKDTNTEFKIKKGEGNNWTLEKAWTVETLGKKINLANCAAESASQKQCDFGTSINVYDSANAKVTGATLADGSRDKKLTYELGQEGHNQGIKFTTTDTINLQGGEPSGNSVNILSGSGISYQIKEEGGTWYLVKKSS